MADQNLVGKTFEERMDDLYRKADAAKPVFDSLLKTSFHFGSDIEILTAPNKKRIDATAKLSRGGGKQDDPSTLKDIVRATLRCRTYFALYLCQSVLEGKKSPFQVERSKDRFTKDDTSGGYRDCNYCLSVNGFLCELQLQIAALNVVKEEIGHPVYEIFRVRSNGGTGPAVLAPPESKTVEIGRKLAFMCDKAKAASSGILTSEDLATMVELKNLFEKDGVSLPPPITVPVALLDKLSAVMPRLYEEYTKRAVAEGLVSPVEYQLIFKPDSMLSGSGPSPELAKVTAKTGTRDDGSGTAAAKKAAPTTSARGSREV